MMAENTSGICAIFCTPTLDHRVSLEYKQSLIETVWALSAAGIPHGFNDVGGDCFIAKARNRIVSEFYKTYSMGTDLFFLDDDIGWPAHKVLEFLRRPEDIVCGAYPKKTETPEYPVELETLNGAVQEQNGLYLAISAPTGFMRIKRHVLDALVESRKEFWYLEPELNGTDSKRIAIFEAGVNYGEHRWWGEDFTFCFRARELGFKTWIDPDIAFTHRGNKRWSGNFNETLQSWIRDHKPKEAA